MQHLPKSLNKRLTTLCAGLALLLGASGDAAAAQMNSNDAVLEYDDAVTIVTNFVRTDDHVDIALGTTIRPDGIFNDLIRLQVLNVGGASITLTETITNLGTAPWEEWGELPADIVNPLNPAPGFVPVSWSSFDTVPFDGDPATPGTFEEVTVLELTSLVFRMSTPLEVGESFTLAKELAYAGALNDPLSGVQVLSFGAALPIPAAAYLFGSALLGLGLLCRRRR